MTQQIHAGSSTDHPAAVAADALGTFLAADVRGRFGGSHARLAEIVPFAARLALECIATATRFITMSSIRCSSPWRATRSSRAASCGSFPRRLITAISSSLVSPTTSGMSGASSKVTTLRAMSSMRPAEGFPAPGASDAALAPYHVERLKLFVLDRLAEVEELDAARIARASVSRNSLIRRLTMGLTSTRMARFYGPPILSVSSAIPIIYRKSDALYYEFEETGLTGSSVTSYRRTSSTSIPSLLEQRFSPHPGGDPVPERHLQRTSVDCRALQQCVSRRARIAALRAAAIAERMRSSSLD